VTRWLKRSPLGMLVKAPGSSLASEAIASEAVSVTYGRAVGGEIFK
jgi:hypothetical protein